MSAVKRLTQEFKELTVAPPEGIAAGPVSDENFFEWIAYIMGPDESDYEAGVFQARLSFPKDYPLSPPKMKFTSKFFHPNVFPDGTVCISILHPPGDDPLGYESCSERWSPIQSIEKILLSVLSMLAEPNDESPANVDASVMHRDRPREFTERVDACVRASLGL